MGGFIDGQLHRVPGAQILCRRCDKMLDESKFAFNNSHGYHTYCKECTKEKQREDKAKDIQENGALTGSGRLTPKGEDYSGNFTYKGLLENLVKTLKVGDIFKVGGRKIRVEAKYPSYVLMMWQGGRMESFVWDDVYKIVNGTYKVRVSDEG